VSWMLLAFLLKGPCSPPSKKTIIPGLWHRQPWFLCLSAPLCLSSPLEQLDTHSEQLILDTPFSFSFHSQLPDGRHMVFVYSSCHQNNGYFSNTYWSKK
jgi:hypothetical protein